MRKLILALVGLFLGASFAYLGAVAKGSVTRPSFGARKGKKPVGTATPTETTESPLMRLAVCQSVADPVDHVPKEFVVPAPLDTTIRDYRAQWKKFCQTAPDAPSLSTLFAASRKLARDISSNLASIEANFTVPNSWELFARDGFSKHIPGLRVPTDETLGIQANFETFSEISRWATQEDQMFFGFWMLVSPGSLADPWIIRSKGTVGCVNFGTYQWTDTLKNVVDVRQLLHEPSYLGDLADFETRIYGALAGWDAPNQGKVCACGDTKAVEADLKKVQTWIKEQENGNTRLPKINTALTALSGKKIKLLSDKTDKCGATPMPPLSSEPGGGSVGGGLGSPTSAPAPGNEKAPSSGGSGAAPAGKAPGG